MRKVERLRRYSECKIQIRYSSTVYNGKKREEEEICHERRHKIEETRQTVIMGCSLSDDTPSGIQRNIGRLEIRQGDSLAVLHLLSLVTEWRNIC